MSTPERYLVTGALGCIGAWVIRRLLAEGCQVVALDQAGSSLGRLELLVDRERLAEFEPVRCDITDLPALSRVFERRAIDGVIHLAALQVPFCRASPSLGASVNVVGTVNVFEAVKACGGLAGPIVYASSVAAFDAVDADLTGSTDEPTGHASTLYGVYKHANEGTARVYASDDGIPSIGLRPYVVYGVGRDQGTTSSPTTAMLAAAADKSYDISYSGTSHFQFADDVAAAFIAAARSNYKGAGVFNLGGSIVDMVDVVAAITAAAPESEGSIRIAGPPLPFPPTVEHERFAREVAPEQTTPLLRGVEATVDAFRRLLAERRIAPPQ